MCKWECLGQGKIFHTCLSFCPQGERGLYMMSLPVWLSGTKFLLRGQGLCAWSLQGCLCPGGLPPRGLCPWVSVKGDRDPPAATEAGGTPPTGVYAYLIWIYAIFMNKLLTLRKAHWWLFWKRVSECRKQVTLQHRLWNLCTKNISLQTVFFKYSDNYLVIVKSSSYLNWP